MEEHILIIFDNITLRKIFGLQRKEVMGACSNCMERSFMTLSSRRQIQVLLVWSNQGQWLVCGMWKAWEKLERKQGFRWTSWMGRHFGRSRHACIKRSLKQGGREGGRGLYSCWLRVGSGVELLWTGFWTSDFLNMWGISWLAEEILTFKKVSALWS